MVDESLGANTAPEKSEFPKRGGESKGTAPKAAKTLRSPAYAAFEVLDSVDVDDDVAAAGVAIPGEVIEEYEKTILSFEEGQIVKGTVSEIRENEIIVDVGFKSEGTITVNEFRNIGTIKIGDQFDVYLEKLENQDGLVVLSKEKADFFKVWGQIKDAHESDTVMEGTVKRRIKGGLVVDLLGVDAFLPGSQIALRQVPNLDDLIGRQLLFKIIKINKRRRNIVVSRRVVLEAQREEQKRELLDELEVGQVREGTVKNITDFGAFVDLGGVDGLLHLTDMTWGRISHPSEIVQIGETLKVKVLDFDKDREKISLGLKQLTPYPWDGVEERYPLNVRVTGRVVSITDYGAFVELEKGVEGLIHISEMSWTKHVKHPSRILSVGQEVDAVVLKVDKDHQKVSLGLKQIEPDPWTTIEHNYPVGTRIRGTVRNLTNFGAFVEIEEGIDGLLHISDMSWAKRVRHPSEVVKKNDTIDVVVLDISQEKKRISLGMKQLTENPWDRLAQEFAADTDTQGKITRILDRGAVVELRSDVEGFVPAGQMGFEDIQHPEEYFTVGDVLPLRVIKVDPKNKRIVLSVSAYLRTLSEEEVNEFYGRFQKKELPASALKKAGTTPDDADDVDDVDDVVDIDVEESDSTAEMLEASPEDDSAGDSVSLEDEPAAEDAAQQAGESAPDPVETAGAGEETPEADETTAGLQPSPAETEGETGLSETEKNG